ncbi:MAG TPA: hypothetical protein VHE12_08730 [bacterium]|nr:hypothetical protein [bacterium]
MKKLVLGLFALVMTLAFCAVPANAATSKKKKKETKKEEKKETKKAESHSMSAPKHYLSGTNTWGRSGLLFGDTADVAALRTIEGSAHLLYSSPVSGVNNFGIPFGGHFGIADNVELSAAGDLELQSATGYSSSIFLLDLGGKYKFHTKNENLGLALGGDVLIPTSGGGSAIVTPRGVVSYTLPSGMLVNGDMGIHISSATYVSVDAGLGYPFSNNFTGMVEIGANQNGNGGSVLGAGFRAGADQFKFQGLLGIPLNGGGVVIGGGIILASK